MSDLIGGNAVEVTFTASKVSTTGNFSANIKSWNWSGTNVYVEVNGNNMKLSALPT